MKPVKLVIFDLAGTIIEDHGEVVSCFARALRNNGVPAKEGDLLEWKGSSKRDVIRCFVGRHFGSNQHSLEERTDRTFNDFRQMLQEEYQSSGVVPIKGAEMTFRWLLDRSIRVATTTGFDRETNNLLLRTAGWQQIFSNSICSSDVALGRPLRL